MDGTWESMEETEESNEECSNEHTLFERHLNLHRQPVGDENSNRPTPMSAEYDRCHNR